MESTQYPSKISQKTEAINLYTSIIHENISHKLSLLKSKSFFIQRTSSPKGKVNQFFIIFRYYTHLYILLVIFVYMFFLYFPSLWALVSISQLMLNTFFFVWLTLTKYIFQLRHIYIYLWFIFLHTNIWGIPLCKKNSINKCSWSHVSYGQK